MSRTADQSATLSENINTPSRITLEMPSNAAALSETFMHERELLTRDALLWQRYVRYLALLATILLAVLFSFSEGDKMDMLLPVGIAALAYVVVVALTGEFIRRATFVNEFRLPALMVTADITALTAIVSLTGSPTEVGRILIGATLIVQLAVFYFGRALGTYAAILASIGYYVAARVVAAPGIDPIPGLATVFFSLGVFGVVCAVLITAYGSFRERMNRLRVFCKLVEDGEIAPTFTFGADKRPDDLTLLARSFEAMRARLAEQIGTDPLTGCLNRRALETRLRTEWRSAKRRDSTVAVLALDMDHFKQINDTRGHPVGDLVLQELAGLMKTTARDTDAVARLGGDEFVILLPDTGWQGALTFAERLRRKVDDFGFGGASLRITISIGIAFARGADAMSPESLLQEADRSLYKAKSGGRNRIFA
ncbi:MAG: GGDEF domain-containing protein [Gemmatimonadota bacterium]